MTPPPGFEARAHRRIAYAFPSLALAACPRHLRFLMHWVADGAPGAIRSQYMTIAHAAGVTNAVEELQDLDGALTTYVGRIAKMPPA